MQKFNCNGKKMAAVKNILPIIKKYVAAGILTHQ